MAAHRVQIVGAAREALRWIGHRAWLFALGVGLAGCSSLPNFVPDLSRRDAPPVQLSGARGLWSASQSKAVLDRLRIRGEPTDIFARHLTLEEAIVGSPPDDDYIQIYGNLLSAISSAETSVQLTNAYFVSERSCLRRRRRPRVGALRSR